MLLFCRLSLLCFLTQLVTVASNTYGVRPINKIRRWEKKNRNYNYIPQPKIIRVYNSGMGGVDRCDQLLSFYR